MALPEFTSATQLSTYSWCPRKFRFRYLDSAEPEYRSVSLALGSVVHGVIEWWFEARRSGGTPTVHDAMNILRADFAAAMHDDVRLGKWTPGDLRDHAGRLVRCFLEQLGETEVQGTEMRFELSLYDPDTGECMERPLVGYFDLYLGEGRAMEIKTARSEYTPLSLTTNLQFGAYLMALDEHSEAGELDLAVIVKNRSPRIQRLKLHPNARSERWFLKAATTIEAAIQSGHFPPAPGLGCGGCEFQRRCLGQVGEADAEAA